MTDSLSKSIYQSIAAHAALILFLVVRGFIAPSEPIHLPEAIRVDVVGLPEKEQRLPEKQPEPTPAAPEKVVESKPKPKLPEKTKVTETPKVNLKKAEKKDDTSKKAQKAALERIHQMAALDRIQDEVASQKPKPVKGNKVNAGNALTGLEKIEYDRYFTDLEQRIRQNWSLPQWLADAGLKAQALVLIDESGMVKKKTVIKSSGNQEFDEHMLNAIEKSAPFPAPPDRLKGWLSLKGIIFNFPQRGDS